MYTVEEFDKEKTKVLRYILYKKRTENEVRMKFQNTVKENLLDDIIDYLKEAGYINDRDYIERTINNFISLKNLSIREIKYKLLAKFDTVLGLKIDEKNQEKSVEIPQEIQELLEQRNMARENKDWAKSDELRDLIAQKGYIVKDTKQGQTVEKK